MFIWTLIAYPFLEIYLFILVSKSVGFENAALTTVATSVLGLLIMQAQRRFHIFGKNDFTPRAIENYLFGNLGAFALILPGFISDVFGLIVIFPPTRRLLLATLKLLRFDIASKSTGPFSVLRTYSFGGRNSNAYDQNSSTVYDVDEEYDDTIDAESYDSSQSAPTTYDAPRNDESDDETIDVEFTVRD